LSAASRLQEEYCARVPRLECRGNSPFGKVDVGDRAASEMNIAHVFHGLKAVAIRPAGKQMPAASRVKWLVPSMIPSKNA